MKLGEKLDYLILNLLRKHINPNLTYPSVFYKMLVDKFIKLSIEVLLNGTLLYLFLSAISFIFPFLVPFIFLGSEYWLIPVAIIYLGIIGHAWRKLYCFHRVDYKKGGNQ